MFDAIRVPSLRVITLITLSLLLISCASDSKITSPMDVIEKATEIEEPPLSSQSNLSEEVVSAEVNVIGPESGIDESVGSSGENKHNSESCDSSKLSNDQMPALSDFHLSFYRMIWSEDGYPMRDDGFEHPLYPKYVLTHYLAAYERSPSEELKSALCRVAHAALRRMEPYKDALVIWYEPNPNYKRLYSRHYSGLTQSYYANVLHDVGTLLKDELLLEASQKSFLSLLIPKEENGVFYQSRFGPTIEEVPQYPNSYILNGWLSVLQSTWEYWEKSGDSEARDLVYDSAQAMAKTLPLYDVDALSNSRYGLTGPVRIRIKEGTITDASVKVPDEGVFGLEDVASPTVWQNYQLDGRTINVVFSLASWPQENILTLEVDEATEVQFCTSEYSPTTDAYLRCAEWAYLGEASPQKSEITIPWNVVEAAAVPTNFIKVIDGRNTNVYHSVHIRRLFQLGMGLNLPDLIGWGEKWLQDLCEWDSYELYEGLSGSKVVDPRYEPQINQIQSVPVDQIC